MSKPEEHVTSLPLWKVTFDNGDVYNVAADNFLQVSRVIQINGISERDIVSIDRTDRQVGVYIMRYPFAITTE